MSRPAGRSGQVRCFESACGYARTSSVETPTSAAPLPRAIPWPAAIATRSPVNEPGPVATATRVTAENAVRVLTRIRSIAGKSSSPCLRCACQVSSARTSRPSKSATDAQEVDVSSANNTRAQLLDEVRRARAGRGKDDAALGVRDVLEPNVDTVVGQGVAGAIRPFDDRHPAGVERLLPPGVREVGTLETVEIEMEERQPAASVLAQDDERGARDLRRLDPEAGGDPACEHGLSRAQLAAQREHVVRRRERAEALAESFGVERRVAHEVDRRVMKRSRHPRLRRLPLATSCEASAPRRKASRWPWG